MGKSPIGFMSYVRFDDEHENGRLTEFCKRLSGEVRLQTGEQFEIFQDRNDITWGQQWKNRIVDCIDAGMFLIPIITPSFFKSDPCREELERFLTREAELGRNDLILPLYYVNCPILEDECKRNADPLAKLVSERNYFDWRKLRFEHFGSPQSAQMLAKLATQIADALESRLPKQGRSICTLAALPSGAHGPLGFSSAEQGAVGRAPDADSHATRKVEFRTHIVDAFHRGDYTTVKDALRAAKAGDQILVRPGLYSEGIVIDKAVEIIGDGELGEVILEAIGENTVLFQANIGRIFNLELRQMGGGQWHTIDITQGRLDVEGCDISSHSLACVAVHDGADPRLRQNRIHDSTASGVYVYRNGRGTFEDNEIFDNTYAGVLIKTGGNPTFRRNRIHGNKRCGVFMSEKALGVFEENDIFANPNGGVTIKSGSNPFFRRNRIYGAGQCGVYVSQNGQGTLEGNEIFGKTLIGLRTSSGGNPICRRNGISIHPGEAVLVDHGGKGVFEENDLRENVNGAWDISSDCIGQLVRKENQE
ncbi:MAG: right-handed parallel beta-helix repeat-containing protein [Massilia sp.]